MPFEDLDTITRHNQPPMATVSYSVTQRTGKVTKADKKPKLTISIPTTMCGTSKAKTFRLQIGTGQHAGKLRVVGEKKNSTAGVEPSQHAHFFRWNFGFVPKLGDDHFEGEKRPVIKIGEDEFEIDVPRSWFEVQQ